MYKDDCSATFLLLRWVTRKRRNRSYREIFERYYSSRITSAAFASNVSSGSLPLIQFPVISRRRRRRCCVLVVPPSSQKRVNPTSLRALDFFFVIWKSISAAEGSAVGIGRGKRFWWFRSGLFMKFELMWKNIELCNYSRNKLKYAINKLFRY